MRIKFPFGIRIFFALLAVLLFLGASIRVFSPVDLSATVQRDFEPLKAVDSQIQIHRLDSPSFLDITMAGRVPTIIYGTAWKKSRTADLVELAVRSGFRAIDTACQPKHYFEKGVGDALAKLYESSFVKREDMFLQTKFTSVDGQDPSSIPYDPKSSLEDQVRQSFAVSLRNLRTDYIDSLVMHSPMRHMADTLLVWRVFESLVDRGQVKSIGLSNTYDLNELRQIYDAARIKPKYLQNRFYRKTGFDRAVREFCKEKGMVYQSFWTLTANPDILDS